MRLRGLLVLLACCAARAGDPIGVACPVPRALHDPSDNASTRMAWLIPTKLATCCGVVINGAPMYAAGVICWPLLHGDDIAAQNWPVALVLFDKSRLLLSEKSRIQFVSRESGIQIKSGTVHWTLPDTSRRQILSGDRPVAARRGVAILQDGRIVIIPDAPFLNLAPDPVELLRRFPYAIGPLSPSDVP